MSFKKQITGIKGLSETRRMPRLDKIRLGFKIKRNADDRGFPAELPFFLLPTKPHNVAKHFGGKVTVERAEELGVTRKDVLKFVRENTYRLAEEINVMLPLNDPEAVFPQAYKWYGSQAGIKCQGDGEKALRYNDKTHAMDEIECPCEKLKSKENPKGECSPRAHLLCLVPKVSMGGVFQIDMGSVNSIIDVNSSMDYIMGMVGRIAA